jgi:hypothetical protein
LDAVAELVEQLCGSLDHDFVSNQDFLLPGRGYVKINLNLSSI